MRLGLYTIPHTGTRFVHDILRKHKIYIKQRHVAAPQTCPEWRRVLTVRHPHDCYLTHRRRFPNNTDENFVAMWGHYIWRTQWMDAFYFALDVIPDNRVIMLQQLISFCNATPNFDIIYAIAEEWPKVGTTKKEEEEFPEHMIKPLEFAVEWYNHYTIFNGQQIRHTDTMLSEGP